MNKENKCIIFREDISNLLDEWMADHNISLVRGADLGGAATSFANYLLRKRGDDNEAT